MRKRPKINLTLDPETIETIELFRDYNELSSKSKAVDVWFRQYRKLLDIAEPVDK